MEARYFRTPAEFRRWLQTHHAKQDELWVGFHKVGSGEASISWPESVDQALCYGWIDGRRQRIDEARYRIRFTPRKSGSIWSAVNIRRIAELEQQGLLQPAGAAAFAARRDDRSRVYSHETRPESLDPPYAEQLAAEPAPPRISPRRSPRTGAPAATGSTAPSRKQRGSAAWTACSTTAGARPGCRSSYAGAEASAGRRAA